MAQLREMFDRMVIGKDATAVADFYHPDFHMVSNGVNQDWPDWSQLGAFEKYGS